MAHGSAAIHLNLTRERGTFLRRIVSASAEYRIFLCCNIRQARLKCPTSLYGTSTVATTKSELSWATSFQMSCKLRRYRRAWLSQSLSTLSM